MVHLMSLERNECMKCFLCSYLICDTHCVNMFQNEERKNRGQLKSDTSISTGLFFLCGNYHLLHL